MRHRRTETSTNHCRNRIFDMNVLRYFRWRQVLLSAYFYYWCISVGVEVLALNAVRKRIERINLLSSTTCYQQVGNREQRRWPTKTELIFLTDLFIFLTKLGSKERDQSYEFSSNTVMNTWRAYDYPLAFVQSGSGKGWREKRDRQIGTLWDRSQ